MAGWGIKTTPSPPPPPPPPVSSRSESATDLGFPSKHQMSKTNLEVHMKHLKSLVKDDAILPVLAHSL